MITLLILLTVILILVIVAAILLGVGGIAFVLVFGDVIICMLIIYWLIKLIIKRKNKRK